MLGVAYLDVFPANPDTDTIRLLTELTLALILFADASTIDLRQAEGDLGLPSRLLGIGLPLTVALGALAAHVVFPSMSWADAGLVGAILAPTDAALGVAVVTNPAVPARIRRALNIESGLNDGIATPIVSVLLVVVVAGQVHEGWAKDALLELTRGALIGVVVGFVGGWLVRRARAASWSTPMSDELTVLGLALLSYGLAVNFTGNGFVSAFLAGLVFGAATAGTGASDPIRRHHRPLLLVPRVGHLRGHVRRARAARGHPPPADPVRVDEPHRGADGAGRLRAGPDGLRPDTARSSAGSDPGDWHRWCSPSSPSTPWRDITWPARWPR